MKPNTRTQTPRLIRGYESERWTEVQAVQHEPFIYLHHAELDLDQLFLHLADHALEPWASRIENPCLGLDNPAWTWDVPETVPRYVDGRRLYEADGVVRYCGNFRDWSYAYAIDTNDPSLIARLDTAIARNRKEFSS